MESAIISWRTIHQFGDLWWQHHVLRKRLFVDENNWNIPHNTDAEWDQYDTPDTIYVISHERGNVIAASRLNPTLSNQPMFSYMIRDATLGLLPGIPTTIMIDDPPCVSDVWEATRFTVDPGLSRDDRMEALAANATALASAAKDHGIRQLVALMPPAYTRWLTSIGLPTERIGPITKLVDGSRACVIQMGIHTLVL